MAAFDFHRRRVRRLWVLTGAVALLSAAVLLLVASASGTLTSFGSTFDSTNGDLTPSATTLHDWNPKNSPSSALNPLGPLQTITCPTDPAGSGTNCAVDLTGKATFNNVADNAFGQGSKEDDLAPTVVFGSIPPNKDDLSRFYINQQHTTVDLLYLAWERTNLLGSAHMDFELNQLACPDPTLSDPTANCSANGVTPVRSLKDVLIDFDFGGSGVPAIAYHKWIATANPTTDCESSSTSPCWSKADDLTNSGFADGSVNGAAVNDYNAPVPASPGYNVFPGTTTFDKNNQPKTISSTFGEAAINLEGSGIFTGGCETFGSATLKSRSAGSSFTSELKDFIAPLPVSISNCGEVIVRKHTAPNRGDDKSFSYSSNLSGSELSCTQSTATSFTLNDKNNVGKTTDDSANTQDCKNVPSGSGKLVTETPATGYTLSGISCSASSLTNGSSIVIGRISSGSFVNGGTSGFDAGDTTIQVDLKAGDTVDCTYTNTKNLGALLINKNSGKGGAAVKNAGAKFCYTPTAGSDATKPFCDSSGTVVTDSGTSDTSGGDYSSTVGVICVPNLSPGTYYVNETAPPTGYGKDTTLNASATVVNGTTCTAGSLPTGGASGGVLSFSDPPLFDVIIAFRDKGSTETHILSGTPMACTADNSTGTDGTTTGTPSGWDTSDTIGSVSAVPASGKTAVTVTCTAVVDP